MGDRTRAVALDQYRNSDAAGSCGIKNAEIAKIQCRSTRGYRGFHDIDFSRCHQSHALPSHRFA